MSPLASPPVTKEYLDSRLDGVVQTLRGDIRDFMHHVDQRLDKQDDRLGLMDKRIGAQHHRLGSIADGVAKVKLAVLDYIGTDRAVHNLVRELKTQGIKLDERKIFAA